MNLLSIAHALGGEVKSGQVIAPGPGHSSKDRSIWVRISAQAPDGILCGSFAGDHWQDVKDHVRARLGLEAFGVAANDRSVKPMVVGPAAPIITDAELAKKKNALGIWAEAKDPRGTIVEVYLRGRGLELPDDIASAVLRFHPRCPWRDESSGKLIFVPAMIAAFRNIASNEITGVHRTALTVRGEKIGRRMLGIATAAAVKLDSDTDVTMGLTVGEGIETCLAGRQLGFRPVWAMGSVGGIAALPVLPGIEALTILGETGAASQRAVDECGQRWHAACREVIVASPEVGSDMNDALRGAA